MTHPTTSALAVAVIIVFAAAGSTAFSHDLMLGPTAGTFIGLGTTGDPEPDPAHSGEGERDPTSDPPDPYGPDDFHTDEEPTGFWMGPDECPHGVIIGEHCEACHRAPLPGEPGTVRVSRAEIERGGPAYTYLTTTKQAGGVMYLGPLEVPPDSEIVQRARGLCGLSLLELQDRIAEASGRNAEDYRATCRVALFVLLANGANYVNHTGSGFSFKESNRRWFGIHLAIVGPKRRGKGLALDFLTETDANALWGNAKVARAQRLSLPGVFGGTGAKGALVAGSVQEADHGIVTFPELANLVGLLAGPGGTDASGTVAEFLSSGMYHQALLKGRLEYRSYVHFVGAVQPATWDRIADAVIGIDGRFVFAWLEPLSLQEQAARLKESAEGHPLDPLAVRVFSAKVRSLIDGFAPRSFDARAVSRRLGSLVAEPIPGALFDDADETRHISLTTGYLLATTSPTAISYAKTGTILGDVVLPDPWATGNEALREVLEADARVRLFFNSDPAERTLIQIDGVLGRDGFMGDPDHPVARAQTDIVDYLAHRLRLGGETVRKHLVGFKDRSGSFHEGAVARKILRECDPEAEEAHRVAVTEYRRRKDAGEFNSELARTEALQAALVRRPGKGRPARLYAYVWPSERTFEPREER